jgi:hypothetical protein
MDKSYVIIVEILVKILAKYLYLITNILLGLYKLRSGRQNYFICIQGFQNYSE